MKGPGTAPGHLRSRARGPASCPVSSTGVRSDSRLRDDVGKGQKNKGDGAMRGFYATTALAMLLGCSAVTASGQEMTAQSRAEAAGDAWAATTEAQMTDAERFSLLHGFLPIPIGPYANPEFQLGTAMAGEGGGQYV